MPRAVFVNRDRCLRRARHAAPRLHVVLPCAAAGMPIVTLLPGVVYGPGAASEGNLVGRMVRDHLAGGPPGLVEVDRPPAAPRTVKILERDWPLDSTRSFEKLSCRTTPLLRGIRGLLAELRRARPVVPILLFGLRPCERAWKKPSPWPCFPKLHQQFKRAPSVEWPPTSRTRPRKAVSPHYTMRLAGCAGFCRRSNPPAPCRLLMSIPRPRRRCG